MKELNEIYEELKKEADAEDCEQSLWNMAIKEYNNQKTNKEIKDYSYSINGDILEVFITDLDDNEFILTTISENGNITEEEVDNLVHKVIEEYNFELRRKTNEN